ncbi:hypothetical protein [Trinickia mobilis]|uniref:hypothetical protein n=1 Tax=Trinickia mobilis TaxID=2816356 RepID=UPI001A8F3D3D|nr:hypothetical protein [Trinickia mobilis]
MTITAAEFMAKTPRKGGERVSRLRPYETEILALREKGYSYSQIRDFLLQNGVSVVTETVVSFIKRAKPSGGAEPSEDGAGQ